MWDFLVGLKQATVSGFERMESLTQKVESLKHTVELGFERMESVKQTVESGFQHMESRFAALDRRLVRIDDRLSGLEDLTIRQRLEDHEARITGLEHRNV